ncbi:MAG: BamA/TamA family outer membrane protein, partial [Gemmatimonadota bacterium]|nr:BamA/TamA family outer membrane protein [Gemmatimonadota bacterium]
LLLVDSSALLLRRSLFNAGYADAVVKSSTEVDDTTRVANVQFAVNPKWRATVSKIVITGNDKIHERTIRRSITFKEGDIYRLRDLNRSLRNLYESNLFRRASIQTVSGDSAKVVSVMVQEAPLRSMRSSLGFNTIDFFQTEERFTQFNFFGGARRLELRGVIGNLGAPQLQNSRIFRKPDTRGDNSYLQPTFELSADITQPWFAGSNNSLGASAFAHRRSAAGIFVDNGFGTSATFTRQISDKVPLVANYRFEISKVSAGDVYFCQFFGVCEVGVIGALREAHRLSPVSLSFFADRSDDIFKPRAGFVTRAEIEHANSYTLSDYHYVRASGEFTKYWAIGRTMSLATRAGMGYVRSLASTGSAVGGDAATGREIIHPRKRFYAGGSQSVRGYGENQLGPRILTIDPALLFTVDTNLSKAPVCEHTAGGGVACPQQRIDDIQSASYQPRPLGGSSLLEGNIELRMPLDNLLKNLGGALFVDGAFVGEGALSAIARGKGAVTPGAGLRYYSSAGAIRIDLGIRPTLREQLSVVTEVTDPLRNQSQIVTVKSLETGTDVTKSYTALGGHGFLSQIFDRLQLHLSIGQAF